MLYFDHPDWKALVSQQEKESEKWHEANRLPDGRRRSRTPFFDEHFDRRWKLYKKLSRQLEKESTITESTLGDGRTRYACGETLVDVRPDGSIDMGVAADKRSIQWLDDAATTRRMEKENTPEFLRKMFISAVAKQVETHPELARPWTGNIEQHPFMRAVVAENERKVEELRKVRDQAPASDKERYRRQILALSSGAPIQHAKHSVQYKIKAQNRRVNSSVFRAATGSPPPVRVVSARTPAPKAKHQAPEWAVRCPKCSALPGSPCRTASGEVTYQSHVARFAVKGVPRQRPASTRTR